MDLRFQDRDDVDRAAKEERGTPVLVFLLVLIALIQGLDAWFRGEGLASYGKDVAVLIGLGFVYWIVAPFYYEFRIRTKEIDGKVSAIEKSMNASKEARAEDIERAVTISRIESTANATKEDLAELLERLTAIEEKLTEIQDARKY